MANPAPSDDSFSPGGTSAGASASTRRLDAGSLILAIQNHRNRPRDEQGYWDEYCRLLRLLCRCTAIAVLHRAGNDWHVAGSDAADPWLLSNWSSSAADLRGRALQNGFAFTPVQDGAQGLRILAMVRINGMGDALIAMDVPERERAQLNELIMRAMLVADFPNGHAAAPVPPAMPASASHPAGSENTVDHAMLHLLDVAAQVMNEQRFGSAALVLVNGLATQYQATQVAFGWLDNDHARAVAISHLDRFERNTWNIQLIEDMFLEALGQQDEVWYPAQDDDGLLPAHAKVREELGFNGMCSIPLPDAGGVNRAVLFFGFQQAPAEPPDRDKLMLLMGFLEPWLQALRQREQWWGVRFAAWAKDKLAKVVGPGQVWGRSAALLCSALLLFAVFGKWDYRIDASSQLTTDSTRVISAQFDGRVETVLASAGDVVKQGAPLALLDTRDLRQQEMDIRADRQRLSAEADKARAAGNLAEMEIAQAKFAQAEARMARITHYLEQSLAVAPFDGVVVEGERKDLLNAPVKKGDKLFRVARIDGLYVELLVPEREIRYIRPDAHGQLRLVARPDQPIRFQLSTIIPMAQVKGQEGNHFLIKARLEQQPEAWWRPGMSGTAVIDGGKQNILWIWTHKLIDTLRMKMWWFW